HYLLESEIYIQEFLKDKSVSPSIPNLQCPTDAFPFFMQEMHNIAAKGMDENMFREMYAQNIDFSKVRLLAQRITGSAPSPAAIAADKGRAHPPSGSFETEMVNLAKR